MENRGSKYILIILSVLCTVMIVLSSINDRLIDPVRNVVGSILVPVQKGLNYTGTSAYNWVIELRNLDIAYQENRNLRERIAALEEENNRLTSDTLELKRLRELYSLDQKYMEYSKVAARVIAKDSEKWFQIFRVDKGAADGIRKDMNVLNGSGLCGIVTDVGEHYATVRSIIDDESHVSAMSQYSADICIVSGDLTLYEDGLLRLSNIDKYANISNGDAIVTSNISTKFLPGLLIGYASDIEVNSQHLTKSGLLIPAAAFDNLQEVLIITQLKTDAEISAKVTGE